MIKTIIVDDVKQNVVQLSKNLHQYFNDIDLVASCTSFDEAAIAILRFQPQLLILDIELDNGRLSFDLLRDYKNENAELVFITAFDQYALQAIELSCCDYVLKPYTTLQLIKAIERAKKRLIEKDNLRRISLLIENLDAKIHEQMIALPKYHDAKDYDVLPVNSILYAASLLDHTTEIKAQKDKGNYLTSVLSQGIGDVYDRFKNNTRFVRVHSQYLINTWFVTAFHKTDSLLTMQDGKEIPVSRDRKAGLTQLLHIK